MNGAPAAGKFFILHSSLFITKAKIVALRRTAKNGVSAFCENLLIKSELCVNKNNTLIYR